MNKIDYRNEFKKNFKSFSSFKSPYFFTFKVFLCFKKMMIYISKMKTKKKFKRKPESEETYSYVSNLVFLIKTFYE